jgi:hypothetical protein
VTTSFALLPITADTDARTAVAVVRDWVASAVPESWRAAAVQGGPAAVRTVRSRADYEAWYPVFAATPTAASGSRLASPGCSRPSSRPTTSVGSTCSA